MGTTSDDDSTGWRRAGPALLPTGVTDWLQFWSVFVGGALAALSAIASVFFQYFGVTLEELGFGVRTGGAFVILSITALSAVFYFVLFFPAAKALSNGWLSLRDQVKELRRRSRGHVLAFIFLWTFVAASVVAFFAVIPASSQKQVQVGPFSVSATFLLLLGAMGVWYVLYRAHQHWLLIDRNPRNEQEAKRLARKLRFGAVGATVLFLLVSLLILTINNVTRVREGRATQGWLYRVVPVTVIPMTDVPSALEETLSRCLLYFGQANGVTVLYDRYAETIVRLPTSAVFVEAPVVDPSRGGSRCA